jgi:predicted metal-dependent phosphoesterase TrpH
MDTPVVIERIKQLGALPVLAHPSDTGDEIILQLIEHGLPGLEVYSSYHNEQEEDHFLSLAEEYNLLVTAGSDFHGSIVKPDVTLGGIRGNSDDLLEKLKGARENFKSFT